MIPLVLGLAADLVWGDPRGWPHPVRWIGRAIDYGFGLITARNLTPSGQQWAGLALAVVIIFGTWASAQIILAIAAGLGRVVYWLVGGVMVWWAVALKDLLAHARPVMAALAADDLDLARQELSLIVGRETGALDRSGVIRALLETLAENLADGLIAPLFFLVIGGPALGLAYKAVNTLDSMIGYRHPPYTHIGRWPAMIDDWANWIPARLTALLIIAAAALTGHRADRAWQTARSDARLSASPNAGWPEAALAGALDISLLGPAVYAGQVADKPFINAAGRTPELTDAQAGYRLIAQTGYGAMVLAVVIALIF